MRRAFLKLCDFERSIFKFPKELVSISNTAKVVDAFKALYAHGVTALAVVDSEGKIVGTISARYFIFRMWLIDRFQHCFTTDRFVIHSDFKRLVPVGDVFKNLQTPVDKFLALIASQTELPQITCKESDTAGTVLTKLKQHSIHRVWIVNDAMQPVGVVSLCDLIGEWRLLEADASI